MRKAKLTVCVGLSLLLGVGGLAMAGEAYPDPMGGWAYTYTGDGAAGGTAAWNSTVSDSDPFDALDGTWGHTNDSDMWDASISYTDAGGGVRSQDGYLTIADRVGVDGPNSKYMFAHDISGEGGSSATVIDDGVTLSFRTRLTSYQPDGAEIRSSGKGMFGINQIKIHDPDIYPLNDSAGEKISFALIKASDYPVSTDPLYPFPDEYKVPGLIMNRCVGTSPSKNIDTDDYKKPDATLDTLRVLPIDESTLTDWHEFWITIVADTSGGGTHKVTIYLDGSLDPNVFHVTASVGGNDYPSFDPVVNSVWRNYIAMGNCRTSQNAAFDADFFSWAPGVIVPVPEPVTIGLFAFGGLLLLRRRR